MQPPTWEAPAMKGINTSSFSDLGRVFRAAVHQRQNGRGSWRIQQVAPCDSRSPRGLPAAEASEPTSPTAPQRLALEAEPDTRMWRHHWGQSPVRQPGCTWHLSVLGTVLNKHFARSSCQVWQIRKMSHGECINSPGSKPADVALKPTGP